MEYQHIAALVNTGRVTVQQVDKGYRNIGHIVGLVWPWKRKRGLKPVKVYTVD